ncbi:MAG: hypothetical protein R3B70_38660 [Polyangiaceae bacterium]
MKTRLVRVSNAPGILRPAVVIEEAGLTNEVELEVRGSSDVITAAKTAREGWAEAARLLRSARGDHLLDPPTSTDFEEAEWQW